MRKLSCSVLVLFLCSTGTLVAAPPETAPIPVKVNWEKVTRVSRTTPTLQVVVNPLLRRGSPIHDASWKALKDLGADYVRYVPWLPYPKLAVAELEPPSGEKTSWNFDLIDPMTLDFLHATAGHSRILNFSTIPAWMFKTPAPVTYPDDPNQVDWHYTQGTELRDRSLNELADYYSRLVSWYTQGGFTDELGAFHKSGYHFSIPYWEVFNEIDLEHQMTPEQYTERYDAVVSAIRKVDPRMKFAGLALAFPGGAPRMFEYFLNPANHKPGTPMDMISYHFYATPTPAQTPEEWQYTFFDQADGFLTAVRYIEQIRERLSPSTRTDIDETGTILPVDWSPDAPSAGRPRVPAVYWNASGALYAYVYLETAKMGIDVVGESQLVGYPSQFPSVSMVDWDTGKPNARFEVLRLILESMPAGVQFVQTSFASGDVDAQGYLKGGAKYLLLINKRNRVERVNLPAELQEAKLWVVDEAHSSKPPAPEISKGKTLMLQPFAVAVLGMGD